MNPRLRVHVVSLRQIARVLLSVRFVKSQRIMIISTGSSVVLISFSIIVISASVGDLNQTPYWNKAEAMVVIKIIKISRARSSCRISSFPDKAFIPLEFPSVLILVFENAPGEPVNKWTNK